MDDDPTVVLNNRDQSVRPAYDIVPARTCAKSNRSQYTGSLTYGDKRVELDRTCYSVKDAKRELARRMLAELSSTPLPPPYATAVRESALKSVDLDELLDLLLDRVKRRCASGESRNCLTGMRLVGPQRVEAVLDGWGDTETKITIEGPSAHLFARPGISVALVLSISNE